MPGFSSPWNCEVLVCGDSPATNGLRDRGRCAQCGYDLKGVQGGTACSECGCAIELALAGRELGSLLRLEDRLLSNEASYRKQRRGARWLAVFGAIGIVVLVYVVPFVGAVDAAEIGLLVAVLLVDSIVMSLLAVIMSMRLSHIESIRFYRDRLRTTGEQQPPGASCSDLGSLDNEGR